MAISPQRLMIYLYSAHRAIIFAIAQLSCYQCECSATRYIYVAARRTTIYRLRCLTWPAAAERTTHTLRSWELDDVIIVGSDVTVSDAWVSESCRRDGVWSGERDLTVPNTCPQSAQQWHTGHTIQCHDCYDARLMIDWGWRSLSFKKLFLDLLWR